MFFLVLLLPFTGNPILTIFSDLCTGCGYKRIKYKVISTKLLQSSSVLYLRDLLTVQPCRFSRSSTLVILLQPPVDSSLKITKHSFRRAAPHLWKALSFSACFLSVWCISITQLITVVTVWSSTSCWHFLLRFSLSS